MYKCIYNSVILKTKKEKKEWYVLVEKFTKYSSFDFYDSFANLTKILEPQNLLYYFLSE